MVDSVWVEKEWVSVARLIMATEESIKHHIRLDQRGKHKDKNRVVLWILECGFARKSYYPAARVYVFISAVFPHGSRGLLTKIDS